MLCRMYENYIFINVLFVRVCLRVRLFIFVCVCAHARDCLKEITNTKKIEKETDDGRVG